MTGSRNPALPGVIPGKPATQNY